jgi:peptidyl-prolyl cis-trans isomerase SurA
MPKKLFFAVFALLLFAVIVHADNIVDEIIARVDNAIITRADYVKAEQAGQAELQQQFPSSWQSKWAEHQKETLRGLIDQQLLLEKGKELGITGETQVVKQLNEMRQKMGLKSLDDLEEEAKKQGISWEDYKEQIRAGAVAEQVIGQEVGSKIHPTNDEALAWYNKHQKDLEGAEEVSLSEIMVAIKPAEPAPENKDNPNAAAAPDKPLPEDPAKVAEAQAKANALLEQLRKGAKFEDVVKQSSDGPTAADGGRLGNFKRGELVKEFEDKTFSVKAGEYTDVIRTKQGFIILKVNAHRAAGVPPFTEIEDRIKQAVYVEKLEPAARAYLTKLRDEAYIDIKAGYVDTGASPNQTNKPVLLAAAGSAPATSTKSQTKKKKKFLVF